MAMPLTERLEAIRNGHVDESKERRDEQIARLKQLSGDLLDLALELRTEYDRLDAENGELRRTNELLARENGRLSRKLECATTEGDSVPW